MEQHAIGRFQAVAFYENGDPTMRLYPEHLIRSGIRSVDGAIFGDVHAIECSRTVHRNSADNLPGCDIDLDDGIPIIDIQKIAMLLISVGALETVYPFGVFYASICINQRNIARV